MAWRIARSLGTLRNQVNAMAPRRSTLSDGDRGDPLHAARASDHNPDSRGIVHAWDVTQDPADGCDVDRIFAAIVASGDSRVSYLIRNRRITQWQNGRMVWAPYSGSNPHILHGHISVTVAGEDDTRPWSIGGGTITPPEDDMTEADRKWFYDWRLKNEKSFSDIWRVLGVRADGDRITDLWDQERATQAKIDALAAQVKALQDRH